MVKAEDLDRLEKRARMAAFQDGWFEILAGAFFLLMGLLLFVNPTLIPFSVLLILAFKPLTEAVKRRFIYPRMGFVRLAEPGEMGGFEAFKIVAVTAAVFAGSILILLLFAPGGDGWQSWLDYVMPAATGILCAFGPLWNARRQGFPRGYLYAALLVLGGIGFPLSGLALGYDAVASTCLTVGLVALMTGIICFLRFLRCNPVQEESHVNG